MSASSGSGQSPARPRAIVIVLDSVGVGELPDAPAYGDAGSDTLGNIARRIPLRVPALRRLGLGVTKLPLQEPRRRGEGGDAPDGQSGRSGD